jgi:hypothetical protein
LVLQLQVKDDARFAEAALRALRISFGTRPALQHSQLMAPGFAEQKILLVFDALERCRRAHNDMCRDAKAANAPAVRSCDPVRARQRRRSAPRQLLSAAQRRQGSLSTALRARTSDTPAAGAERPTPHAAVEVLPGSAVRSRVLRAQQHAAEDLAAAPEPRAAVVGAYNGFGSRVAAVAAFSAQDAAHATAYDSFALDFEAEPSTAWELHNDVDCRLRASSSVAPEEGRSEKQQQQAALDVAVELQHRLRAMEAVMKRLEARMRALETDHQYTTEEAAPAEQPRAPPRNVSIAAPRLVSDPVAAAPAGARTEDLRAFIDGVITRFEETRMLLASTQPAAGGE